MADDEADGEYEDAPGAVSSQKSRVSLGSFSDPSVITKTCTWTQVWSAIDEEWCVWQLSIAVYLHLYQLIILGLSTGWRDFQDIHHLKPKLRRIEVLQGGGGVLSDDDEMTDAAHWSCRREDSCTRRARKPFHSNSDPRHQLLRSPSLTTQSCK